MAFSSLNDVRSLPDVLLAYRFDLIIPNIPGGGDTRALTIKCMSTSIPGQTIDTVMTTLHGIELQSAGAPKWSHSLQTTYLETRDMTTRNAIKDWMKFARNVRENTGAYKSEYATTAQVVLYDDKGNTTKTITLEGVWPTSMDDSALDGANTNTAVNISVTYSYDLCDED